MIVMSAVWLTLTRPPVREKSRFPLISEVKAVSKISFICTVQIAVSGLYWGCHIICLLSNTFNVKINHKSFDFTSILRCQKLRLKLVSRFPLKERLVPSPSLNTKAGRFEKKCWAITTLNMSKNKCQADYFVEIMKIRILSFSKMLTQIILLFLHFVNSEDQSWL